jgi:hypothetical protein
VGLGQQLLQRALRMLRLDLGPGGVGKPLVQAGQHDAALRRGGHRRQQGPGRRRGPCGAGGHQHARRRRFGPAVGQPPQQLHPPFGDVGQAQRGQPPRPGLEHGLQEHAAGLPVLGEIVGGEALEAGGDLNLLDLSGLDQGAQGVGQLQGSRRGQVPAGQQMGVVGRQPHQLHPPRQGIDGGGQVEGHVAGLEGGLALVEVAQRTHLGRQDGLAAGGGDEGVGQGAGAPPGRRQHQGLGQGLGPQGRQRIVQALGQVPHKGPVRGDGEPAGRPKASWACEQGGPAHVSSFSLASAASRAAGSPTCIQKASMTAPCRRPSTCSLRQVG